MLAAVSSVANPGPTVAPVSGGGRFDFDDGGTYCGDWEDGKAHGHGVCTGPKGQGEYAGQWAYGFEVQGVYTWPSGNNYEGQWMGGKRHGLGVEAKGRWIYRGEWTHGFKGRYGVRLSDSSGAKYEGTWANGLQDGYGIEFYADGGTFQGQWLRGVRHGYGVRTSAPYGLASHYRQAKALRQSLTSLEEDAGSVLRADSTRENDTRGGFVLRTCSDEPPLARRGSIFARVAGKSSAGTKKIGGGLFSGLKLRKQQSTGDLPQQRRPGKAGSLNSSSSIQSYVSDGSSIQSMGAMTDVDQYDGDSNLSYVSTEEILEANVTEIYMGEWKNDKRAGFGVCDRSDGLKYEGEWFNNKKSGYGITTFKDGSKEEGKYKNNVLVSSSKQRKLLVRSSKLRERIDSSLQAAIRGSQMALQKADIAISRTGMARGKAESADQTAGTTREDMAKARVQAKLYAPSFYQPGPDVTKKALIQMGNAVPGSSLAASNLLYNPALRNSPSPQPPPRIPTQAKDPPKPAAPAYQPPLPVAVAPSPVPNTSEQDPMENSKIKEASNVKLSDMLENDLAISLAKDFLAYPTPELNESQPGFTPALADTPLETEPLLNTIPPPVPPPRLIKMTRQSLALHDGALSENEAIISWLEKSGVTLPEEAQSPVDVTPSDADILATAVTVISESDAPLEAELLIDAEPSVTALSESEPLPNAILEAESPLDADPMASTEQAVIPPSELEPLVIAGPTVTPPSESEPLVNEAPTVTPSELEPLPDAPLEAELLPDTPIATETLVNEATTVTTQSESDQLPDASLEAETLDTTAPAVTPLSQSELLDDTPQEADPVIKATPPDALTESEQLPDAPLEADPLVDAAPPQSEKLHDTPLEADPVINVTPPNTSLSESEQLPDAALETGPLVDAAPDVSLLSESEQLPDAPLEAARSVKLSPIEMVSTPLADTVSAEEPVSSIEPALVEISPEENVSTSEAPIEEEPLVNAAPSEAAQTVEVTPIITVSLHSDTLADQEPHHDATKSHESVNQATGLEPALRVPTPAGRVPTPVVPQEAPMVAASPAASSRIASPVAPTASPTPRPTSPAVAVTAVESAAALAAPAAVDPASVIIKPFTQLHVSSSTVPSPAGQPPPSPAPASPVPPQHLALPSESVDYPENFSGSRRGSAKPVLQRMEGFDADLSGAKFAKVSLQADRFSQYGAKREDSGIGSEIGAPLSTTPGVSAGDLGGGQLGAAGAEEQLLAQQLEQISLPSLQRRKSLPSLVKRDITGSLRYPEEAAADAAAAAAAVLAQPETIMIEGATRKRLVATDQPGAAPAVNAAPTLPNPRTPVSLPKAVVAETISPKLSKSQMNRSFTDLASANQGTEGISRVEASQLGSQRREEIRRAKEFEAAQTEFDRFRAQMKSASGEATPNVNEEDLDRVSVGSQGSRSSRASRLSAIHGGIQQLQENNRAEEELVNSLQAQIQEQAEIDELMQDYMRERKRQIRIGRRKRDLQEQLAVLKQQDENDIERRMRVEPVEVTPEYLENASTEELQEVYALQQREHRRRQLIRRIGHLDRKMKGSEDRRQRSERRKKNRHERARRISDEEEDAAFPAERSESLMSTNLPPPLQLDAGGGGGGGEEVPGATNESADQMARIRRGY